MRKRVLIYIYFLFIICKATTGQNSYLPEWSSLDERTTPAWFSQAKFGILIHWGVYSVPSFMNAYQGKEGSNAEWYGPEVMYKAWRNNSFHINTFGKDFKYRDFAPYFKAELWNPMEWAGIFEKSGAKYVVLTAKHHDGYCLWPTKDTFSIGWNSLDTGPQRDIVGELADALRRNSLKFGIYYSLMEFESTQTSWPFDERYANERTGYYIPKELWDHYHIDDSIYADHIHFQLKELVQNYRPDIIFADGAWDKADSLWRSREFLAWLYNKAPNKRDVLVNDRWGNNTQGRHGSYFTSEYSNAQFGTGLAWEETQGIGNSFAYNRSEKLEDYKSGQALIELLCRTVCKGGNLLLNIGPRADGIIPLIQQERLAEIGKWLDVNGKAIYKTTPLFLESEKHTFTKDGNSIYVFQYDWTQGSIKINLPEDIRIKNCILLGLESKLVWKQQGNVLLIIPPVVSPDNENVRSVYVFQVLLEQK